MFDLSFHSLPSSSCAQKCLRLYPIVYCRYGQQVLVYDTASHPFTSAAAAAELSCRLPLYMHGVQPPNSAHHLHTEHMPIAPLQSASRYASGLICCSDACAGALPALL